MCEHLSSGLSQSKAKEVGLSHWHILVWLGGGCWWLFLWQPCLMTNVLPVLAFF